MRKVSRLVGMESNLLPAGGSANRLQLRALCIAAQHRLHARLRISAASHGGRLWGALRLRPRPLPDMPRAQLVMVSPALRVHFGVNLRLAFD